MVTRLPYPSTCMLCHSGAASRGQVCIDMLASSAVPPGHPQLDLKPARQALEVLVGSEPRAAALDLTRRCACSMLSDAKVYRGSNSCRVRITSSLNGHTFVAKYFGDDAVMRREHGIRRTAAVAALPPVRHMDIKRHRHVVQSAVSITPEVQALDSYTQHRPRAFATHSSKACSHAWPCGHFIHEPLNLLASAEHDCFRSTGA